MPKQSKQVHIDFIVSFLKKGMSSGKILAKFVQKWQISERTYGRLLNLAKIQHNEMQQAIKNERDRVIVESAVESLKLDIMTSNQRKEYLTKMINGEIGIPRTEIRWDTKQQKFVTVNFIDLPPHNSRISSIAELNKMEGDYAPNKTEISIRKLGKDLADEDYV